VRQGGELRPGKGTALVLAMGAIELIALHAMQIWFKMLFLLEV
jgi:hypothetical protein